MSLPKTEKELAANLVQFATKSGLDIQARVKEMAANSIAFELFTSEAPLELSEVLSDVTVKASGQVAYRGDIVITGMVPLGVVTLCEARLKETWMIESFEGDDFLDTIAEQLEEHTVRWAQDHEIRPSFRAVVSDMEVYLDGLESWCGQLECGGIQGREDSVKREESVLEKLGPIVSREIASHFREYEREVALLDGESRLAHRAHLMKALHRFILQSPFSYRCFTKPLGYAGDYGMVKLMLGNPYQGKTLFAKLLNASFLETGPVVAHQNRINYLVDSLHEVVSERAAKGLRTRILNLGCGPAEELQRFIRHEEISETCDFQLLDFSDETLEYTKGKIAAAAADSGRDVKVEFIEESIQGFLKRASKEDGYQRDSYDFVYCAGLFDYLQQRFCAKLTSTLYDICKPGGLVAVTNVSKHNTIPFVMEDFLEWSIIDRSEDEMWELAPDGKLGLLKDLKSDSTRINLFLELRKPVADPEHVRASEENDATAIDRPGISGKVRGGRGRRESSQL